MTLALKPDQLQPFFLIWDCRSRQFGLRRCWCRELAGGFKNRVGD